MLKVFNTLTRTKEEFKPLTEGKVRMYVCGPTVYNYIHIGNARSAIAFDTIRRYLEYRGYDVTYVSNFTDVDDKMINQARADGITVGELADKYINAFMADTGALNIEPATVNPRATENIPEIIAFIAKLIENGYAYEVNGDVYYRAKKFAHYGELSDQNIAELETGASQHVNDEELAVKEDPIDFALWKAQKLSDEISWESPWGQGRPGWHIECSVMSTKYLGETFDIHGGGQDLQFPHHENEIAQSEAKTGKKFVNYWLHNGFVTVGQNDEKMSKSLGNFVTVHELLQHVDARSLRFFMASTQYRRPIRYTEENLVEAGNVLQRMQNTLDDIAYRLNDSTTSVSSPNLATRLDAALEQFTTVMDDDFNVQNGLTVVYGMLRHINQEITKAQVDKEQLTRFVTEFKKIMLIFGIEFKDQDTHLDAQVADLLWQRDAARDEKNFAKSDEIREQLKEMGIVIEDTPQGTRWKRIDD
ncbi:cysteinyl-tRNA synthetase [Amylolactobacillus amylotrophicus DSM 20534]|uniref:Cysteine--tRNA ligase n=2 Tax=Amylolactobacillus TaxID=2767876 RepID=A0A0R1YQ72_9LACO|nr:cysteinyl-tRNA synthetase [Amylolactobacillus amylotrophicus DSM 20534]KRM42139.1 cysteinyl-tRNA synthetase [Amylolactobacillus amylophilus DSM 20533 = JCM 1125]GED80520.1 cysteine--tRNA ligase [Amylolactobacillus amylophilus]